MTDVFLVCSDVCVFYVFYVYMGQVPEIKLIGLLMTMLML